jgi:hypothetical protein
MARMDPASCLISSRAVSAIVKLSFIAEGLLQPKRTI